MDPTTDTYTLNELFSAFLDTFEDTELDEELAIDLLEDFQTFLERHYDAPLHLLTCNEDPRPFNLDDKVEINGRTARLFVDLPRATWERVSSMLHPPGMVSNLDDMLEKEGILVREYPTDDGYDSNAGWPTRVYRLPGLPVIVTFQRSHDGGFETYYIEESTWQDEY